MASFIPVYKPSLSGNELDYVTSCLNDGWVSSRGTFVNRFESSFAEFLNISAATSVSNGTVALHLALYSLGLGPGDEIIVPAFTYIASVNAISYVGARPVFVDSEPSSWNIDVSGIEACITNRTKAILAVHLYGAMCDMPALLRICDQYNLFLIEDVAEAFGSKLNGSFAGSFGHISTFSFFGNKTITTGEGGMIASNNPAIIERAAYLKSQAVSPVREYWHDEIGFNYRMTNICAAIGLAQLERANKIIIAKREIYKLYYDELCDLPVVFQSEPLNSFHTYWMVSILLPTTSCRDLVRVRLKAANIESRPLFYPAHLMPVFHSGISLPTCEDIFCRGLNLPSYPELTSGVVHRISQVIRSCF